jgi:plastocyanin
MKQKLIVAAVLTLTTLSGCKDKSGPAGEGQPGTTHTMAKIDWNTAGTISGTVKFSKKAPSPVEIDMAQDPVCGLASTNMSEQFVVHNGRLANVFVYIKDGLGNRMYPAPQKPIVLDQKGCRYVPHVIGIMIGQPVEYTNSDATMHNVHLMPQNSGNQSMDISQPPKGGTTSRVFSKPELMIPVRCNNHPWMQAFINVSDNPFFAVTDEKGNFEVKGLPPGTYTLGFVHESLGEKDVQVTIKSQQTTTQDFEF